MKGRVVLLVDGIYFMKGAASISKYDFFQSSYSLSMTSQREPRFKQNSDASIRRFSFDYI